MALRIGFKIHRYLGQNKFKFLVHEPTRNTSSKPKYIIHPLRQFKSSSHTNLAQKKYTNERPMDVSNRERDQQVSKYEMDKFGNSLQPSAMPEYFTSTFQSNLANFPEKSDLVRGRFSKSSTQKALTIKFPQQTANPVPERLKSFPSDTMADDEKAKLMQEEAKMVARDNLQQSQEAVYEESAEIPQLQLPATSENDMDEALMQSKRQQARTESESKPRTRAARYLKTSRHIKPTNQQRRFSSVSGTQNPLTMSDLEQAQQSSRCFSTKSKSCKPDKKKKKPTCTPMKSAGCADPNPNKCEYVHEESSCKKLEAPYPSYSECMGHLYEEEPSECKICPWSGSTKPATSDKSSSGKKKYSTFTAQLGPKTKPPCTNPYDDKKPCEYERTAEKQDEKRRKRPAQPSPRSKPGHKKSFCTLATAKQSFHTLSKSSLRSKPAQHSSLSENMTVVERIRGWLNSWRPGSDNIRITRSSDVPAGRETYIIEIQDIVNQRHSEIAPWFSAGSLRPAAQHVVTSSGFSCDDSAGKQSGKVSGGGGCPPPKKKEQNDDDKKKCRQRKKRKLPSCNDVGKNKPKKDALNYSSIQTNDDLVSQHNANDQLSQQTQEINALKEPHLTENVPFKLKRQFWRV